MRMPGFSFHPPPPLNPSPSPCCCGSSPFFHPPVPAEDDLRRLLDRIPSSLLSSPGSDHELVWQCLGYGDDGAALRLLCPGIKKRVHALVHKLLNERAAAGSLGGGGGGSGAKMKLGPGVPRKRKRDVQGLLEWVRDAARDPVELFEEARRWRKPILKARKVMFEKLDDEVEAREFPSSKKRGRKFIEESHKKVLHQPKRRSERIANNAYLKIQHLLTLRKRIGVGPTFQADIPEWTGPVTQRDISDYKVDADAVRWLGTQVRPADVDESGTSGSVVGKGRSSKCTCFSPGSKTCISTHVQTARLQLKVDLGQFFTHWGFDSMGEGILESWGEEKNFAALNRLTEESNSNNFWKIVSKHFSPKSKPDLVNYYFNVFVLRKIGNQSRQAPEDINTDEEEDYVEEEQEDGENAYPKEIVNANVVSSSRSSPMYPEEYISFSTHFFFS